MTDKYGIKETEELIVFIAELGNGIGNAVVDKKWSIGDLIHFVPALKAAIPAFSGIDQVPLEFWDLSEEEQGKIKQRLAEEFDIPEDEAEEFVERAFNIAMDIMDFVKDFFFKETASTQAGAKLEE